MVLPKTDFTVIWNMVIALLVAKIIQDGAGDILQSLTDMLKKITGKRDVSARVSKEIMKRLLGAKRMAAMVEGKKEVSGAARSVQDPAAPVISGASRA